MVRSRGITVILLLLVCASTALSAPGDAVEFPPQQDRVSVRLERAGPTLLLAPVRIDGQDGGVFLVDTGASSVILDRKLVERLGLKKVAAGGMQVVGGNAAIEVFPVSSVSVGGVGIGQTFVASGDLSGWREMVGERFGGVLGNDFLSRMPFTLDHREAELVLYRPEKFVAPAGQAAHPLVMLNHDPGIRVRVEDEVDEWFVLDSGIDSSLQLRPHLVKLHESWATGKPFHMRAKMGMGRVMINFVTEAGPVRLLGSEIKSASLAYTLESEGEFPSTVGYVGMGLLRQFRLTMDYAGKRVWAEPAGERPLAEWDVADLDLKKGDATGMTALMRAVELGRGDYVARFIAAGADVNGQENDGDTALHYAAKRGDAAMVKALLAAGAAVGSKTKQQETPLISAAGAGSAEAVQLLLDAKAAVDEEDIFGNTALIRAAEHRDGGAARALLKAKAKVDVISRMAGSALYSAVLQGNTDTVAALLEARADPNARQSPDGGTPLGVAAYRGWEPIVRLLLDHRAQVDGRAASGQTPLHLAAREGRTTIVRMLLEAGADRSARDGEGKSPFDRANEGGHLAAMRLLYVGPAAQPAGR